MRAVVGVGLALVALAGCGSSDERNWPGPPAAAEDGTVPVGDFADYQEAIDESWETAAVLVAAHFLNLGRRVASSKSIREVAEPERSTGESVTVELDGLLDDAVRAELWTLHLEPSGEEYRLVSASVARRCQPGHGHEEYAREPCT